MRPMLFLILGVIVGIAAVVVSKTVFDAQRVGTPIVSDTLRGYVKAHGMPNDLTAAEACPLLPALGDIVKAPSTYRGRCVYAVGYVPDEHGSAPTMVQLTLPAPSTKTAVDEQYALGYVASGDLERGARVAQPIPPGQPVGYVWVRFVEDQDRRTFWQQADTKAAVGMLGTLDGSWQDAPLVDVVAAYYQTGQ